MPHTKTNNPHDHARSQQLTVVVRIRPLFEHEEAKGATKVARKADHKMVLLSDPTAGDPVDVLRAKRAQERKYVFDWAFDENSTQEEVYEKTTKALVESVVEGFNGTVFAYGATGSGKTYTMVGEDENPGIMVRALKDLFKEVDTKHKIYDVSMSYLEIYNENIRDLLNPSPASLELREDAKGNHQVAGLSEVEISSSEEVMTLLMRGNKRRTQESTGANKTSSRSHAVLVVQVKRRSPAHSERQHLKTGRLYMVDLAGSERAAQTQNTGKRLLEGAHINKSLLALGNCINALAERNPRYVNFRDSKLTRILKEPLSGNCRTVMVSHVSPSHFHFEESRNTLSYADRAKNITTKVKSNVSDVSYHVAQYQTIISELRQEIETLQRRIKDSKPSPEPDEKTDASKEEKKLTEEEMKTLKQKLVESFNTQMDVRRRMMEIDNTLLAQNIEFDKLGMVISEWETDKAISTLEDTGEPERDVDSSDSNRSGVDRKDMPDHVQQAWDDLQFVKNQHHRYLEMREDCDSDYKTCKQKTLALTESLSSKASSREQRELLHLLARVYQLEIEKLEMQSAQLIREHELRCRDLMLLRYDRQRQLCDEIITKQRMLIDSLATGEKSQNVHARRELNELYRIYQQEIQELSNGRNSDLGHLSIYSGGLYRQNSSGGLRPLGSSGSMLELHQLDSNKYAGSPSLRNNTLPPITALGESGDADRRLFQRRQREPPFRRGSDDSNAGVSHHLPPLAGEFRTGRTFSRFSNSSSNSSSSIPDGRSISTGSPLDYTSYSTTSSNGRSSHSSDHQPQKLTRLEELEEPLKKRFGLLPSLRQRKGRGTSSDSEVLTYNRNRQMERDGVSRGSNQFRPEARKHKMAEERRIKAWGNGRNLGH